MGLGCRLFEEPKNEYFRSYISPIWGEKIPCRICTKLCTVRLGYRPFPRRCKFWRRSVKPFSRCEWSNFRLYHKFSSSSLQHSHTTVRVRDSQVPVKCVETYAREVISQCHSLVTDTATRRLQTRSSLLSTASWVHTRLKVGFHYPSSRAEFTGRVDGPRTRVHFLTPVNSGRELG